MLNGQDSQKSREITSKFRFGQTTGQKADPASVSKSMMTARDSNGQRLFTSAEFLTSQQVSSFFSRLSSKGKLGDDEMTDSDIEENQDAKKRGKAFCELRREILQEVALTHPICYDCYDVCEIIANSKLSNSIHRKADRLWEKMHMSGIIVTRIFA